MRLPIRLLICLEQLLAESLPNTDTSPVYAAPAAAHPGKASGAPHSPQPSREKNYARWGNAHVRRKFRKLESRFNEKCDELAKLQEKLIELEEWINQLHINSNEQESRVIEKVSSLVLENVESLFGPQMQQLKNQIQKDKQDYTESLFDLYRHIPKYTESDIRSDRDVDASVQQNPNGLSASPESMFREDKRQMLIIGGVSLYNDDDKAEHNKFIRRSDVFSYDPETRSTIKLESLPEVRSHHCAVVFENQIFVIGGATRNDQALKTGHMKIDESWESISPMRHYRMGLSCSVFRGRIWACGGRNGSERFNTCEAYHYMEGWRDESSMYELRYLSLGLTTSKGLYMIGGAVPHYRPSGYRKCITIEHMAIKEDRFKPEPEPPFLGGVVGAAGTVIKDAIFLMGGQVHRSYPTDIMVLWPHKTNWERIGKMSAPRKAFQVAFINSLLFAIGGSDKIGNEYFDISNLSPAKNSNLTGEFMEISHQAGTHQPLVRSYHSIVTYLP